MATRPKDARAVAGKRTKGRTSRRGKARPDVVTMYRATYKSSGCLMLAGFYATEAAALEAASDHDQKEPKAEAEQVTFPGGRSFTLCFTSDWFYKQDVYPKHLLDCPADPWPFVESVLGQSAPDFTTRAEVIREAARNNREMLASKKAAAKRAWAVAVEVAAPVERMQEGSYQAGVGLMKCEAARPTRIVTPTEAEIRRYGAGEWMGQRVRKLFPSDPPPTYQPDRMTPLLVRVVAPGKPSDGKIVELADPRRLYIEAWNDIHVGFGITAEPVRQIGGDA